MRGGGETYPSDVERAFHRGGGTRDTLPAAFSEGADRDASWSMVVFGGLRGIVLGWAA